MFPCHSDFELTTPQQENQFVVFCPSFYDSPTLSEALNMIRNGSANSVDIVSYMYTRGEIYFHESLVILQMVHQKGLSS